MEIEAGSYWRYPNNTIIRVDRVTDGDVHFRFLDRMDDPEMDSEAGWQKEIGRTLIPISDGPTVILLDHLFKIRHEADRILFFLDVAAAPGDILEHRIGYGHSYLSSAK